TFITLPDVCLLIIFDELSLHDLLTVGMVCIRFKQIQRVITRRRQAIRLVMTNAWNLNEFRSKFDDPYPDDQDRKNSKAVEPKSLGLRLTITHRGGVRSLADEFHFLMEEFPNITELEIVQWGAETSKALNPV